MNLLVGATGFVGGHLVEYLFQQNEISKGIFRKGAYLKIMDLNGVQGVEASLLDHHSLHEAMEGVDTIYNLASPMPDTDQDFSSVNTEGLSNLLEVAQEAKAKAFVHLSTLDVYGFRSAKIRGDSEPNPAGDYQRSKLQADEILLEFAKRQSTPRITIIRAARAIGPRDASLTDPILRMIDGHSVVLPSLEQMSFSHPKDVAQAMFKAATSPGMSRNLYLVKSFDAGTGELVSALTSAVGKSASVKKEGLTSRSRLPSYARAQLKAHLRLDMPEAWSELGYSPKYDLKSTCSEIAEWHRKDPWATRTD